MARMDRAVTALGLTHPGPRTDDPVLRDSRHKPARALRDLEDFLSWLALEGKRDRTIRDYEWALARLLRTFKTRAIDEFTDGDIAYVLRSFPPAGRRTKAAAYRKFFAWAKRTRRITENPMELLPNIRQAKNPPIRIFTDAEIIRLTSLPAEDGTLMLLLLDAGLRKGEARHLRARDIDLAERQLAVIDGKGGNHRVIPLTGRLTQRLAEWFLLDAIHPNAYLWYSRPGGYHIRRDRPISESTFGTWYRRCLEDATVTYRKPHTTRHTFATRWLRKGGRLNTLSLALGHASIRTTADEYAHMDISDLALDVALTEKE